MNTGLSESEARKKLLEYGKNRIETQTTATFLPMLLSQFPTIINGILVIAAIFSLFLKNFLDAGFIFAIIIINAFLGFIQEYRAQQTLEKLKDYTVPVTRVIRDGKDVQIPAEAIVPGDSVVLSEGARVPADGKLLDAVHLEINESILTGESLAVIKEASDEVFSGTLVTKGKGIFQVDKTGIHTRFGLIANTLATIQTDKTPIQKNLDQLGKTISFGVLVVGMLIIPIGLLYHQQLIPLILTAASIGVAAIPEGLPAVITIAFAFGTRRMAKQGAIVRKMTAVETLGAIQVILIDKTGTITKNAMQVKKIWLKNEEKLPLLTKACILGNTASLVEKGTGKDYEIIGDQTDGALLIWVKQQAIVPNTKDNGQVVDEYVFDTKTKTITTVWRKDNEKFAFVRGAPEAVIAASKLTENEKEQINIRFEEYAKEGLRIIGFGVKPIPLNAQTTREYLEKDLVFLGLIGIYDAPRTAVKEAMMRSRNAGIQVIMVTGDNELTALSIGKEVGLIENTEDIVTSEQLQKMSDEELSEIILKTRIFARCKPEEKLRLVSVLKNKGLVVGVTGDGVNDALALKKADVGVAMGEGGTDVAKEAADIIITDNNFSTLIKAIEEGRTIYKNIVNAVLYLLSGNLAEISIVFFATLLQLPLPLLPTQILWINLVTDSLPALALATGSKDPTVLKNNPRSPTEPILTMHRIIYICLIGFSLAAFLLTFFSFILHNNTQAQARTAIFNLLIYFQLLIVMWIGRHSLKRGNIFLIATILIIFFLQIMINLFPITQEIFHLEL